MAVKSTDLFLLKCFNEDKFLEAGEAVIKALF